MDKNKPCKCFNCDRIIPEGMAIPVVIIEMAFKKYFFCCDKCYVETTSTTTLFKTVSIFGMFGHLRTYPIRFKLSSILREADIYKRVKEA